MMWRLLIAGLLMPLAAGADTLVANRTLRAQTVLTPGDLGVLAAEVPGALRDPGQAIGQEARVTLYAGRPIHPGDIGPPAIVQRNQLVVLSYRAGGIAISTEGRALARAGAGEQVRIMNLASRSTVVGRVAPDGTVLVALEGN